MKLAQSIRHKLNEIIHEQIYSSVWNLTWYTVQCSTSGLVDESLWDLVDELVWDSLTDSVFLSIWTPIVQQTKNEVRSIN